MQKYYVSHIDSLTDGAFLQVLVAVVKDSKET